MKLRSRWYRADFFTSVNFVWTTFPRINISPFRSNLPFKWLTQTREQSKPVDNATSRAWNSSKEYTTKRETSWKGNQWSERTVAGVVATCLQVVQLSPRVSRMLLHTRNNRTSVCGHYDAVRNNQLRDVCYDELRSVTDADRLLYLTTSWTWQRVTQRHHERTLRHTVTP